MLLRAVRAMAVVVALGVSASHETTAQSPNLWIGTWKVNLAKSKYSPGPPPRSTTRTWEDRGGGVVIVTTESVTDEGNPSLTKTTFKYDGRDYPTASIGAKSIGTMAARRIDAYTVELTFKTNGKVTTTARETVSKDGKTMILQLKGTNARGEPVSNYVVLEKQ